MEFTESVGALEISVWTAEVEAWEKNRDNTPNPFLTKHDRMFSTFFVTSSDWIPDESQKEVTLHLAEQKRKELLKESCPVGKSSPSLFLELGLVIEDLKYVLHSGSYLSQSIDVVSR